jgi:hypothetical protein
MMNDDPTTTISSLENSLYDYIEAMLAVSSGLPISLYAIHYTGRTQQKTPAEVGLRGHRECWITPKEQDIVCRFPVSKDGISVTEMRFKYIISLWVRHELLNMIGLAKLKKDNLLDMIAITKLRKDILEFVIGQKVYHFLYSNKINPNDLLNALLANTVDKDTLPMECHVLVELARMDPLQLLGLSTNTFDEDTMRLTIPMEGHSFLDLVGMNQARVLKKYQFPDHESSVFAADILLDFNALISLDKTPTASSVDSIQIEVKKSDTNAALWKEKL